MLDLEWLFQLISAVNEDYDRDRERTDRTITLMIRENEQLNLRLQATISKLAIQTARFAAALENMSHGLCMSDRHDRLVVANGRFAEILSWPADVAQPGVRMAEILNHMVQNGVLDRNPPEQLMPDMPAAGDDQERVDRIWTLADGRVVEATFSRTDDASWVALFEDVSEQRQAEAQIHHMARHDPLTDLPNRSQFHEAMEWQLARVDRGEQVAIMCVDLDHFKPVNDTLGHPIGDKLLIAVAERMARCVRQGGLVARLGGDEFAIIQAGVEQPVAASSLARRHIEQLSEVFVIDGHQISIGASIGVSVAPVMVKSLVSS